MSGVMSEMGYAIKERSATNVGVVQPVFCQVHHANFVPSDLA
jgi:hypothetical protein